MQKQLLVNGVGMTGLTPITKMMAPSAARFSAESAKERVGDLFWNGHDASGDALVGNFVDRGGVRAERT